MIAFVEGDIRLIRSESVVLDVHGVGYEVFVASPEAYSRDVRQFFYTYMQVRDDGISLFGFPSQEDYEVFISLIRVKGIGARIAMKALGKMSGTDLLRCINEGDVKTLKSLPGIGQKTAGQIILDLRGKVIVEEQAKAAMPANPVWAETREALLSLGYKPADLEELQAEMAGNMVDSVDVMLRKSLQFMARRNGV